MAAGRRTGNAPSGRRRPRPSPAYHRHRPPWRLGRPAGNPGLSRRSGLDPRWPAGSDEPAQTLQEPPPPPQRQSSALKRLSFHCPTARPVRTAPRFDTVQSTAGLLGVSAPDPKGSLSNTNRRARIRCSNVRGWRQTACGANRRTGRAPGSASETKESPWQAYAPMRSLRKEFKRRWGYVLQRTLRLRQGSGA